MIQYEIMICKECIKDAGQYTNYGGSAMQKVRWGVLGTANIARGCTIPGMKLAESCELYAVAGRSIEKAESFRMSSVSKKHMEVTKILLKIRMYRLYIFLFRTICTASG